MFVKLALNSFVAFRPGQVLRRLAVAVIAVGLIATEGHAETSILAPGYRALEYPAPVPGSYTLPKLGAAADASVLTTDEQNIQLHKLFENHIVLLSFIYTTCDDVNGCPLATSVLHKVKRKLAELLVQPANQPAEGPSNQTSSRASNRPSNMAAQVKIITLSFDPEHDTPRAMENYGKHFRGGSVDWQFLTTSGNSNLAPILTNYGQTSSKILDENGNDSGRFAHILRVFLIDKNKTIRNIYSSSFLHPESLGSDIKTLMLEDSEESSLDSMAKGEILPGPALANKPLLGLPALPVPADNPQTHAGIKLGRKLFFDRRLSLNNTMSCAMCHLPDQGFSNNEMATAVGIEGRSVRRNAPTLYNVAYLKRLFHDGREYSLEQQIWGPLLANNELGNPSVGYLLEKLRSIPDYQGLFELTFGSPANMHTVGMALASYQRTLNSANSAFDRWYFGNQKSALNAEARAGFKVFTGKGRCSQCHSISERHALFTDNLLHNTGIGYRAAMQPVPKATRVQVAPGQFIVLDNAIIASVSGPPTNDLGLYEITQSPQDRWKYRTPGLRNIALTAPYMHDGSLTTLEQVVAFYNLGGFPNENQDSRIKPLNLSGEEKNALVVFLRSLTGSNVETLVAEALASKIGDPD